MSRPRRLIRRCRRPHGRAQWEKRLRGLCRIVYMHLEKMNISVSLAYYFIRRDKTPYRYGRRQCSRFLSGLHVLVVVTLRRLRRRDLCRLPRPRRPVIMLNNWETMTACARTGCSSYLASDSLLGHKKMFSESSTGMGEWGLLTLPTVSPAIVAERFQAFLIIF